MASLSKGVQLRLFLEEAKKSCKVEVYKEERWALKSMPEVVNGIPRYVYSRTTGKALSQSERVIGEELGGRMTPHLGRLMEMPLWTLQVATTASIRRAMTGEEGRSIMSSAKRRQGGKKGCGSRCAID
jgi:hypothetical protein